MNSLTMAGHLIRRLHQISGQVFAEHVHAAGLDLTPVQFAALDAIRFNPGLDQAGIAALIAYDKATIGGVIDRLTKKGLVSREVSSRDRRARVLDLTQEGHTLYDRLLPVVTGLQGSILGGLTPDEQARFLELAARAMERAPD